MEPPLPMQPPGAASPPHNPMQRREAPPAARNGLTATLVLAGIAIDQPTAFGGYIVAVALAFVALGRLGVIAPLRAVT
ncbi:MAG: hypothetical protein ABR562_07505, partial [Thermoplasmatota archaeon]